MSSFKTVAILFLPTLSLAGIIPVGSSQCGWIDCAEGSICMPPPPGCPRCPARCVPVPQDPTPDTCGLGGIRCPTGYYCHLFRCVRGTGPGPLLRCGLGGLSCPPGLVCRFPSCDGPELCRPRCVSPTGNDFSWPP